MNNPNPKPEHRITAVEKRVTHIEGAIEELASDQAEELRAIRQEIKGLDEGMKSSFDEIGEAFTLLDSNIEAVKATMATKEDLRQLEARIDHKVTAIRTEMKQDITAMEVRLIDTIKQLWQQRPSE